MIYAADIDRSEYRTEAEHSKVLHEALAHGTPEKIAREFHIRRELLKLGYNHYHLPTMFKRDGELLAILGSRLARSKTWAEFDDIFELVLREVPEIKTVKTQKGDTLASNIMLFAAEYDTDPIRIKTMLVKFKNNGIDFSSAESQLPNTFTGRAVAQMVKSAQHEMQVG